MITHGVFKRVTGMLMLFVCSQLTSAQQTAEKFVLETQYLLYLPDGYANDTSKKWPLLIFLHGSGESGDDLNKVKAHGPPKLIEKGKKFPFIVVSPQAPPYTGWRPDIFKGMLEDLKKKYRVDKDRVYLTGLSMGGFGTWNISEKYPDDFAAIAPICGGGDETRVWRLRHMPVWCFHGAKDDVVLPAQSERMVNGLKNYNDKVRYTLYPDANHNSWDTTYNNDSLYTWLLSQKKFRHKAITISDSQLKKYEGVYVSERDTLKIEMENGKLMLKPGNESIEIKPSSDKRFFWDDNSVDEVSFLHDKKGAVSGFTLLADVKMDFKKVQTKSKTSKSQVSGTK
jgi:dienelactone hydrolase